MTQYFDSPAQRGALFRWPEARATWLDYLTGEPLPADDGTPLILFAYKLHGSHTPPGSTAPHIMTRIYPRLMRAADYGKLVGDNIDKLEMGPGLTTVGSPRMRMYPSKPGEGPCLLDLLAPQPDGHVGPPQIRKRSARLPTVSQMWSYFTSAGGIEAFVRLRRGGARLRPNSHARVGLCHV